MPSIHGLIIDDDPLQRSLIRLLVLNIYPAAIITEAPDGQAALISYGTERADLIITDIQMPILDGIALTSAIRTHDNTLPIIVVSATRDGEILAYQAGASRYVDKNNLATQIPHMLAEILAI